MAREASDARSKARQRRRALHRQRSWLAAVYRSFSYAFDGIAWVVRSQRNAQIHVALMALVLAAGTFFRVSVGEWLALILSIALVLAFEAINSAVEAVVDLASPELHPLARRAKDAAAGAVLVAAIGAALVGIVVFLPRVIALIASLQP